MQYHRMPLSFNNGCSNAPVGYTQLSVISLGSLHAPLPQSTVGDLEMFCCLEIRVAVVARCHTVLPLPLLPSLIRAGISVSAACALAQISASLQRF